MSTLSHQAEPSDSVLLFGMKSQSSSQNNASLIPVKQTFASSPGLSHGQRFHFYDEVCESRLEGKFMGGNKGI